MNEERVDVHEKALDLPAKPGVYIMQGKNHEVIYVGKAKRLVNRVSSYFRENPNHNLKTRLMVSHVWDFDYIVTDTEFEALVLENSLIKRHMPKYNILLKDDKGYPFIRVSVNDDYPTFTVVSKPQKDGARYFGPYSGRSYSKAAIDAVRTALMLPCCARKFPRDIGKGRPCLNAHLGKCCAVCSGKVPFDIYRAKIEQAISIFDGKTDDILASLGNEMVRASDAMEFEAAAKARDSLRAIERLGVKQKVLSGIMSDRDVIGLYIGESRCTFTVLHYIGGALLESETTMIDTPVFSDAGDLLSGFIREYYMPRRIFPKEIFVSDDMPDAELLSQWLTGIGGTRVSISCPKRGDKVRLTDMARANASEQARIAISEDEIVSRTLLDLQAMLGLTSCPMRIESYDISNTAGSETVASMIVFRGAKPLKSAYRKFKIKTVIGQDDYAAMHEVLMRRMERYVAGDDKFKELPDVILLDGGRGQVSAVAPLLRDMGIATPVFGMVKDDRHRTRAIVREDGAEVGISANPGVFKLVGTIQEEVHRFAIGYHRKLRAAHAHTSVLEKISGIGDARRSALLRQFKSLANIRAASIEELARVVPMSAAVRVYNYFNDTEER